MLNKNVILGNGYEIPSIGFGTWKTPDGEVAIASVKKAIECGYTHIDTAACYKNEKSVGEGIRQSGIEREKLFVTSKLWNTERGCETTKAAFYKTLDDLGLDYLDLYLIHWPANSLQFDNWAQLNADTWRAFEELYEEGKIKAIGLSNFMVCHLEELMKTAKIKPMVNQIEYHPGYMQKEVVDYCNKNGILVEAWSPIGSGRLLENALLTEIAAKYGRSVAQICIRWCLQNDALPLPKSVTPSRIEENLKVLDFEISEEDMQRISSMELCGWSGLDPEKVTF
jgi:diketogulonate reductase-like aldo/keto reductase